MFMTKPRWKTNAGFATGLLVKKSACWNSDATCRIRNCFRATRSFPDEVVANVDVLRVGGSGRVIGQVQRPHIILLVDNGTAETLIKRKDETPQQVAQENRFLEPVTYRNILRLTRRKRDTLLSISSSTTWPERDHLAFTPCFDDPFPPSIHHPSIHRPSIHPSTSSSIHPSIPIMCIIYYYVCTEVYIMYYTPYVLCMFVCMYMYYV